MKRWLRIKLAEARLRRAEAVCRAMRRGPGYDVSEDDYTYYSNVVELHDARDALKAVRETA